MKRVIPVLLVDGARLVKTKQFGAQVYLGDPINTLNIFNEKEVDEIIVLDISASRENRGVNFEFVKNICDECFMPLAYGGGINSIEDIQRLFKLGLEKIIINHAKETLGLIEEAVSRFGSQSIVVSIDIVDILGEKRVYEHVKKVSSNTDPIELALDFQGRGAGEIFINFVDRDGMRTGYDEEYINIMSDKLNLPLIACGGAANVADLISMANHTNVSAVAAGSVFVLYGKYDAPLITYPTYDYLKLRLN